MRLTFRNHILELCLFIIGIMVVVLDSFFLPISLSIQWGFFYGMIFLAGVPHGALDYLIDARNDHKIPRRIVQKHFLIRYISMMLFFAAFWILPIIAVLLFLLVSAYHFGETDLNNLMEETRIGNLVYFLYGCSILTFLFVWHIQEVDKLFVFMHLFFHRFPAVFAALSSCRVEICIIACLFFLLVLALLNFHHSIKFPHWALFQYLVVSSLIILMPLLIAFTFYFATWHAFISIRNIKKYMAVKNNVYQNKNTLKQGVVFSLLALSGIALIYLFGALFNHQIDWIFALVIALSILTLPHLDVMHKMYKRLQKF